MGRAFSFAFLVPAVSDPHPRSLGSNFIRQPSLPPRASPSMASPDAGTAPASLALTRRLADIPGVELTPFAKRLPKPQRTGSLQSDCTKSIEHAAIQKIISLLQDHPSHALMTLASLQSNLATNDSTTDDCWGSNVKALGKLPVHWVSQWLVDASQGELRQCDMEKMVEHDSQAAFTLFHFATQTKPGHKLPVECLDKKVCSKVFFERAKVLGKRLVSWKEKALTHDGSIKWGDGGCYKLTFEDGKAKTITHVSGDSAKIPSHVTITKDFILMNNFSDSTACLELAPATYTCKDFFLPEQGPNKHELSHMQAPELKSLAEVVKGGLQETSKKLTADTIDEDPKFLQEASKKRQLSAVAKAREARAAHANKKKKMRQVDLNKL